MANAFLQIKGFADDFDSAAEETMRATTNEAFTSPVYMTPVDDGRAKASWVATGANPSTLIPTGTDKTGEATAAKITAKIYSLQDWSIFTLTNNLPYIYKLEYGGYPNPVKNGTRINKSGTRQSPIAPVYKVLSVNGYSEQAPQGMLRITFNRIEQTFNKNAAKAFK